MTPHTTPDTRPFRERIRDVPESELRTIAGSIRSGTTALLPEVEHELYDFREWQDAADQLLIGDDPSQLEHMLAREAAWNEFGGNNGFDSHQDFGDWVASKGYRKALTLMERGGELAAHKEALRDRDARDAAAFKAAHPDVIDASIRRHAGGKQVTVTRANAGIADTGTGKTLDEAYADAGRRDAGIWSLIGALVGRR